MVLLYYYILIYCARYLLLYSMSRGSKFDTKWLTKARDGPNAGAKSDNLFMNSWNLYFGGGDGGGGGRAVEMTSLNGSGGSGDAAAAAEAAAEAKAQEAATLSYGDRFKGFAVLLSSSGCFFMIAFMFLPTVVLFPGKFALAFTVASLLFMGSFAFLRGPAKHFRSMLAPDRLPFSLTYVGSLLLTIYSCMAAKGYIMTVSSVIFQIASLMWYASSFLPGGKYGMRIFTRMFCKTLRAMAGPCLQVAGGVCKCCVRGGGSLLPT